MSWKEDRVSDSSLFSNWKSISVSFLEMKKESIAVERGFEYVFSSWQWKIFSYFHFSMTIVKLSKKKKKIQTSCSWKNNISIFYSCLVGLEKTTEQDTDRGRHPSLKEYSLSQQKPWKFLCHHPFALIWLHHSCPPSIDTPVNLSLRLWFLLIFDSCAHSTSYCVVYTFHFFKSSLLNKIDDMQLR